MAALGITVVVTGVMNGGDNPQGSVGKTFLTNPDDFNPEGLTKQVYDSKNGKIIK